MSTSMTNACAFLWEAVPSWAAFVPEDFNDEQRMIAELTEKFSEGEVVPLADDIEDMKPGLMPQLLRKAGELGLLSADVPQEWGGMGLDVMSSMLITENFCANGSFAVSHSDHTAFGILPIALFGNDEQKAKYLPELATGQKLAAYALTEAGAGSDAFAAQTKATLSADGGHYVLNGSKQFITNAGFADVIVTFAKAGDGLAAFLVDRDSQGLSLGNEEKKTGIRGSSTRSVTYEDVKVPAANLLFEAGKGHLVAFNVLNLGRLKLAAQCVGTAKVALKHAVKYALERKQFGKPIAQFGLIQDKLARISATIYVAESMLYRSSGRIEETMAATRHDGPHGAIALGAHAAECSMNKVFASEGLAAVADETVQIFGGYGYVREYPADQIYRNARINRIFAGTNEINRLLVAKALAGSVQQGHPTALPQIVVPDQDSSDPTAREERALAISKRALLFLLRMAVEKHGVSLSGEQEVLGLLADLAIQIYAIESALLRTRKAIESEGAEGAAVKLDMLCCYCSDAASALHRLCVEAFAALAPAEELGEHVRTVDELVNGIPLNTIPVRRRIASHVGRACQYAVN